MKRLLLIEFKKLFKNRASKVLIIVYFTLFALLLLISNIEFNFGPIHINIAEQGIFNFPFIWHFNTYIADFLKIFLAVVIVSMMANEYSYGTLKQNLIDGLSKKEFILSKFITVVLFAGISTLLVFSVSLFLGLKYSSFLETSIILSDLEYILAYFVKLTCFFSFCLFLGILIKRSAFALGFLLFWYLIEKISYGILKFEVFQLRTQKHTFVDTIYDFFPLEAMSNLLIEPFSRLDFIKNLGTQVGIENTKNYSVHFTDITIVMMWIFIFVSASYWILKKRDL